MLESYHRLVNPHAISRVEGEAILQAPTMINDLLLRGDTDCQRSNSPKKHNLLPVVLPCPCLPRSSVVLS
jgi:hypothetical protein